MKYKKKINNKSESTDLKRLNNDNKNKTKLIKNNLFNMKTIYKRRRNVYINKEKIFEYKKNNV